MDEILAFLSKCPLPWLASSERRSVISLGANSLQVYKRYANILLSKLKMFFKDAPEMGRLHSSMNKAVIILLFKPGKVSLSLDSYRPI